MKTSFEYLFYLTLLLLLQKSISALTPQKELIKILTSPEYDREIRPAGPENTTVVSLNLFVRGTLDIDDNKMEFTTQLTLRQYWMDSRLKYDSNGSDMEFVTLDDQVGTKMWSPDVFFANEIKSYMHSIVKPNSFMKVYPPGNIMWSSRLTVTFSCPMDLHYFPFDKQTCNMMISSYAYTKDDLLLEWAAISPLSILGNSISSRFQLINYSTDHCTSRIVTDKYNCVFVSLSFKRQFGYYLINMYIPCVMCVMLSWVSFWLGPSVSTRLSLTVTILLTLATQIQGYNQNGSKVSYSTALDYWTGFCTTFGSLAILESAYIAFLIQAEKNRGILGNGMKIASMDNEKFQDKAGTVMIPWAIKVDKISRIAFPGLFAIFVAVYLLVYVVLENTTILELFEDDHA